MMETFFSLLGYFMEVHSQISREPPLFDYCSGAINSSELHSCCSHSAVLSASRPSGSGSVANYQRLEEHQTEVI